MVRRKTPKGSKEFQIFNSYGQRPRHNLFVNCVRQTLLLLRCKGGNEILVIIKFTTSLVIWTLQSLFFKTSQLLIIQVISFSSIFRLSLLFRRYGDYLYCLCLLLANICQIPSSSANGRAMKVSACKNISIGNTEAHRKCNVKRTKTKFCDNTGKY